MVRIVTLLTVLAAASSIARADDPASVTRVGQPLGDEPVILVSVLG